MAHGQCSRDYHTISRSKQINSYTKAIDMQRTGTFSINIRIQEFFVTFSNHYYTLQKICVILLYKILGYADAAFL